MDGRRTDLTGYRRIVALLTALPFVVFATTGSLTLILRGLPAWLGGGLLVYGCAGLAAYLARPSWAMPLIRSTVPVLVIFAWVSGPSLAPMVASTTLAVVAALSLDLTGAQAEMTRARQERDLAARQLDRRMHELFTLQELSLVLSESLKLDHIVSQVTRYARRFLEADGAMVVLIEDDNRLRIPAAEGSLAGLMDRAPAANPGSLLMRTLAEERPQAEVETAGQTLRLEGVPVRSTAAVPLRAHGVTLGVLAVADRREGSFNHDDLQLLGTVATHAAVVLANSRFFEMLRRGKEEWETAFNALTEGLAVLDDQGRISRANQALGRLLGIPAPALIGQSFRETAIGETPLAGELLDALQQGGRPAPVAVRADRLNRVLRLAAAPFSDGGRQSVVVLIEDTTEQRKLEAQLIQNEMLAAVGQLVSGVAHELNNPLTSIAGLAEFLLVHARVPAGDREHLKVIHEQADRAGRIVRNLLTFARKGGHEKSPVDLNDIASRTVMLVDYELRIRGITLERELCAEPVTVLADGYELQQVLLNLLTNAIQALGDPPPEVPRRMRVSTGREGERVSLAVHDSGPGIPPQHQAKLFTPFFTTKETGTGTGLGLSISYGIVEAHGGHLDYGVSPLGGACFTLTLPATDQTPAPPPPRPSRPSPAVRRILLVDDDLSAQRILTTLLSADGHEVDCARTGQQALTLAGQRSYDLVMADAQSVVEAGLLFVRALLSVKPEYRDRIILTTAVAPLSSRDGFPIATKPFNLREVRGMVEQMAKRQ
ncbi:MAG: ATP-binding protein [Gemmatimonadales bacterium]